MTKSRSLAMLLGNLSMLFPSFFSLFFLLILKPIWIKEVRSDVDRQLFFGAAKTDK